MQKFSQTACCFLAGICFFAYPAIAEKASNYELNERLTKLEEAGGWTRHISVSGAVEVEAGFARMEPAGGDSENTSDLSLATVELAVDADITDNVFGSLLFLYEDDEDIVVDEGFIQIAGGDGMPMYLKAGEFYLPFGNFASHMISDPLTLELAEIRETALEAGFEGAGFYGALYLFNGDVDEMGKDSAIDNFGATAGYGLETDAFSLDFGIGYINNMMDSDGLTGALDEVRDGLDDAIGEYYALQDYIGGITVHGILGVGPVTFIGEYTSALDNPEFIYFDGLVETPEKWGKFKAWNIEAGCAFDIGEKEAVVALSYQGTDDTEDVLPESRILATFGIGILDNTSFAIEYRHDAYENDDAADAITAQLAIEF